MDAWICNFDSYRIQLNGSLVPFHSRLVSILTSARDDWSHDFNLVGAEEKDPERMSRDEIGEIWSAVDNVVFIYLYKSLPDGFMQLNANFSHLSAKYVEKGKCYSLWSAVLQQMDSDNPVDRINNLMELVHMKQESMSLRSLESHYAKFFALYGQMAVKDPNGLSVRNANDLFMVTLHSGMKSIRSNIFIGETPNDNR